MIYESIRDCHGLIVKSAHTDQFFLDPTFGPVNQQLVLESASPLAGWIASSLSVFEIDEEYAPFTHVDEDDIEAQLREFEAIRAYRR